MISTGRPPILRPMWSSASSKELRMSLPMAATGPLKVLMKPILIVLFWAVAGPAASNNAAPATIKVLRICSSPGQLGPSALDALMYWQRRQNVHHVTVAWGRRMGTSHGDAAWGRRMGTPHGDVGWRPP